jgi:hypothetical protein
MRLPHSVYICTDKRPAIRHPWGLGIEARSNARPATSVPATSVKAMTPALIVHIGTGIVGLLSGTLALSVPKGRRLHKIAGHTFFAAMLIMASLAAYLAFAHSQRGNALGGIFTFYLVATGWMTVRRRPGGTGRIEIVALFAALGAATTGLIFGLAATHSPTGLLDGVAPPNYYVVGSLALLAAVLDLKVILRGGISGVPRVARHVWRLCVGLFVATGSFFLGQQRALPTFAQGSPFLLVPAFAPLVVMSFWLLRIRVRNWSRRLYVASPAPIQIANQQL